MKMTLFEMCKFFEDTADYMLNVGNKEQMMEFSYKADGVMAVIESLGLSAEYNDWKVGKDGD